MAKVSRSGLELILRGNAAEISFRRRTPGPADLRRMLCTLDFTLLNSNEGKIALNFKPITHAPPYNAKHYNLLVVWDIFMQDWRAISMDQCDLVRTIKTTPPTEFWAFFNGSLMKMTPQQKWNFMYS